MPYNFVIQEQIIKPRELCDICVENNLCFKKNIVGDDCCSLALRGDRKIECPYISDAENENQFLLCCYDSMK